MPRNLRIERPGGIYHVLNQGNYRKRIFESEGAKVSFEKTLFEICEKAGWVLHSFVVMRNHYHLAIETPVPNLSEGMRQVQGVFATRFNRFRKERGHLFQGRFKSLIVEDYERLAWLCHYIHLNPVRAGTCDLSGLREYRFGSYWYLRKRRLRPAFLNFDACLKGAGDLKEGTYGWNKYEQYLNWLNEREPVKKQFVFDKMSRGWAIGTKEFKKDVMSVQKNMKAAVALGDPNLKEAREIGWEERLERCLKTLRKTEAEISSSSKGVAWKVAVASWLKTTSLCMNVWLAKRLQMGSESNVSKHVKRMLEGGYPEASKVFQILKSRIKY